jgi:creatinine amidohydrolase
MEAWKLAEKTWTDLEEIDPSRAVALLPVGAIEAHGPHLPLNTDVLIAETMVTRAAELLNEHGMHPLILPPVAYSAARYAEGFPGTISISPETVTALLLDIAGSVKRAGIELIAVANAHLDPAHIGSLRRASQVCRESNIIRFVFPDITRKPWALRLTDEFKSGACHAGQFEGSIVLATRPDLVRDDVRRGLPDNPASLSDAIRSGQRTFEEAGGARAYFGYPARATVEEGRATIEILANILVEAVLAEWPGGSERPTGTGRRGDAERPTGTDRPGDAERPTGTGRPGEAERPTGTDRPDEAERPGGAVA